MNRIFQIVLIACLFCFTACNNSDYTPKPSGFLRTDFPKKKYEVYDGKLPYVFEYPKYGVIVQDTAKDAEPFWINIEFPEFKAKIHLSYKNIHGNADKYIEDTRKLAYKHTIKADAINESVIEDSLRHVYGILYDIEGNTASSVQFFVSDEKKHFIRGALYFSTLPNKDSLAPSVDFFREDILHFINTLQWKN